jgi:hypothetical protein
VAPPLPFVQAQGQGAVSADQLNTFVQTVVNYAQLRTFTGLTNMVVQVQGATAPSDGGQGVYWYNAASTAADNNSTVIVPSGNVGQGAWLQIPPGTIVNLAISGTLTVGGNTTLNGALSVAGIGTFAADIIMSGTGELQLPSGTTLQRSATPALGMIRYNNTLNYLETYGVGGWAPVAGSVTSGIFPGDIYGLLPSSIAGTSTSASLTVATGKAVDSTAVNILNLALAASWSVSNGNAINGYQGGTTLPNSSTIHFFICSGVTGTGVFASLSLTPTLPTGYGTYFRRIFSLVTTSGGAPIPFTAIETTGGSMTAWLATQTLDINATASTANRTLYSMNVPSGLRMQWVGRAYSIANAAVSILITSPDEVDVAPSAYSSAPGDDAFGILGTSAPYAAATPIVTTNTAGQIGVRATAAQSVYGITRGWVDFRRT